MLNEEVEHIPQEAFKFIKRYDVILNNQNKKVINIGNARTAAETIQRSRRIYEGRDFWDIHMSFLISGYISFCGNL